MPDFGVFISVPTESVAVRAAVGSIVAVAVVAILLRMGLRIPRVRTVAVTVPALALLAVVAISWGDLLLPIVMTATEAENALPVPVGDGYVPFAPVGLPLIVGLWTTVFGLRLWRRMAMMGRMRRVAGAGAPSRDFRVQRLTRRVARHLRRPAPRVVIVDGCPGGAVVVGVRQPTLVIDAQLLRRLDEGELEGLLAHELAHVHRRDNLIAFIVGVVRDAFFFVPGCRWVVRRLCTERELAADEVAVATTGRPGALASGLLKVIDSQQQPSACAAFGASTSAITRVERLVADVPRVGPARGLVESALVAAVLTLAVAVSVQLPATIVGQAGERYALSFLWTWQRAPAPAATEATAFAVYHDAKAIRPEQRVSGSETLEPGAEFAPSLLRGLRPADVAVGGVAVRTGARDRLVLDVDLIRQWRATPLVAADEGLGVYWLQRHDGMR